MQMKHLLVLIVLSPLALRAADKLTPLDVKLGLWEVTRTNKSAGMPAIPPEALANLTPEQRARMEAVMKAREGQSGKPTTSKSCVTKEKMDRESAFADERGECQRTIVTSTSGRLEVKLHCSDTDQKWKSDGTFAVEVLNSENVKGSLHMVATAGDHTMNIDNTFTARYLGPACGDVN